MAAPFRGRRGGVRRTGEREAAAQAAVVGQIGVPPPHRAPTAPDAVETPATGSTAPSPAQIPTRAERRRLRQACGGRGASVG
eukprot:gene14999-biopygen12209